MAGCGGAVKNLAMGCAPRVGKQDQHCVRFRVDAKKCVGCGSCFKVCPQKAVAMDGKTAHIDTEKCIGCGECVTVCRDKAIGLDFRTDLGEFMARMVEYAYGAVKNKRNRVGFFNILANITPDCDCVPWSDAPLVPDIGIRPPPTPWPWSGLLRPGQRPGRLPRHQAHLLYPPRRGQVRRVLAGNQGEITFVHGEPWAWAAGTTNSCRSHSGPRRPGRPC
jgi:ferredoxin